MPITVTTRIEEGLAKLIDRIAKKEGMDRSTVLRRIYMMTADENISPSKIDEMKKHNVTGFSQFIKINLPSSKNLWKQLL